MRFVVLGGGLQGSACAYDLLQQEDVERVTVADAASPDRAEFLPTDPRLDFVRANFEDSGAVRDLMEAHEVALSAAPYHLNAGLAGIAARSGTHFSDLGGNTEIVFEQMELDDEARASGATLIPDVGLAPGMVDVLAAEGIRRLDEPESARLLVGGLPQEPIPPLQYQVVYSLRGTLDYYTTPSWILRDGKRRQVDALSEIESIRFPEIGELEAFHTGGGASLLPWRYEGRVETLEYKTLRYPGHAEKMRTIRELGLLAKDPVVVDSSEVVPREVFIACATPHLTRPDAPDLVALRVTVEGRLGGRRTRLRWELLDREDEQTGITAMMRCTGYTLSIVGLLMGRGVVDEAGVFLPDESLPVDRYLDELAARGVLVRHSEEKLG